MKYLERTKVRRVGLRELRWPSSACGAQELAFKSAPPLPAWWAGNETVSHGTLLLSYLRGHGGGYRHQFRSFPFPPHARYRDILSQDLRGNSAYLLCRAQGVLSLSYADVTPWRSDTIFTITKRPYASQRSRSRGTHRLLSFHQCLFTLPLSRCFKVLSHACSVSRNYSIGPQVDCSVIINSTSSADNFDF